MCSIFSSSHGLAAPLFCLKCVFCSYLMFLISLRYPINFQFIHDEWCRVRTVFRFVFKLVSKCVLLLRWSYSFYLILSSVKWISWIGHATLNQRIGSYIRSCPILSCPCTLGSNWFCLASFLAQEKTIIRDLCLSHRNALLSRTQSRSTMCCRCLCDLICCFTIIWQPKCACDFAIDYVIN